MLSEFSRHFSNLSVIILFEEFKFADIVFGLEVDSDTFSTPSSTSTDSMKICIFVFGDIEINNNANLLNINTSKISQM